MKLKELDHIQNDNYIKALEEINKKRINSINTAFSDLYNGIGIGMYEFSGSELKKLSKKEFQING